MKNTGKRIDSSRRLSKQGLKNRRRRRIASIAAFSLVGLLAASFLWLKFIWMRPPDEGSDLISEEFPEQMEGMEIPSDVANRDGIFTVLITGTNDFYNTDTIIVATVDTKKEVINGISIPRDTIVPVNRSNKKINGAFGAGSGGNTNEEGRKKGFDQLAREVALLVGFKPRYFVAVNDQGLADLVDLVKGVEFNVPKRMYKSGKDKVGGLIDLQPGLQTLNGKQAVMLIRYRGYGSTPIYDGETGEYHDDFGRMKTQQEFLKAVAKKTKAELSLSTAKGYLDIAKESVMSNMTPNEMAWLFDKVYGWVGEEGKLNFKTLPTDSVYSVNSAKWAAYGGKYGNVSGKYYQQVRSEEALRMINDTINPFDHPIEWVNYLDIK